MYEFTDLPWRKPKFLVQRTPFFFTRFEEREQSAALMYSVLQLKLQFEETLPSFANLEYALTTVDNQNAPTAFEMHFGVECWRFYKENPEHQVNFSKAMRAVDALGDFLASATALFS